MGEPKPGRKKWRFDQMATNVNDRVDDPSEAGVDFYIGLEHLDSESLKIRRWGSPDDVSATKLLFRPGDIIFGRRRAYQRKLGVAEFHGIASAHALVLRANPDVALPEFLPFFMQSDLFMELAQRISVGSLSPTINWKTLAKQEFALPPVHEQRRWVAALKTLEAALEELHVAREKARTTRLSLSLDLFSGIRPELEKPLGKHLTHTAYGPRFSAKLYDDDGPLAQLRTTDIDTDGFINYSTIPRASIEPGEFEGHLLEQGDIVISRSGTCGLTAVFEGHTHPTIAAAFLIRMRPAPSLDSWYLHEFFSSPVGRALTASLARGGVQKNINGTTLFSQRIPLPPLARQRSIVDRIRECRQAEVSLSERLSGTLRTKFKLLQGLERL